MNRRRIAAVTVIATAGAVLPAAGAIAASADSGGSTVLRGQGTVSTGPAGQKLRKLGDAPANTSMSLSLAAPLPDQSAARTLAAKGVVVSPADYTRRFGASQASVDKISRWARNQGFTVTYVSRDSGQVFVKGTVAKVNKAMNLRIQRANLGKVSGLAPNADPTVSKDSGIIAVGGLSTLGRKQPMNVKGPDAKRNSIATKVGPKANGATDGSTDCSDYWGDHLYPRYKKYPAMSNAMCGYLPQDLQKMYGVGSVASQTPVLGILLWGNDPNILARTNEYMKATGFPLLASSSYKVFSDGKPISADCAADSVNVEQALDVQSTHAIAPNATIHYYDGGGCEDADLTAALQKMVTAHQVSTISMSFGTTTDAGMTSADKALWDRPLLQAQLTGISTFASSGDSGNNSTANKNGSQGVGYPASSSYTTAVGGTAVGMKADGTQIVAAGWENRIFTQSNTDTNSFTDVTFAARFLPVAGAGGGQSAVSTQPSWQKGKVGSYTRRAVPDISALADPATSYTIRVNDNTPEGGGEASYFAVGGTSLASPIVSALVGVAKKKNGVQIGLAAPYLYKLAGTSAIKDINYAGKSGVFYNAHDKNGNVVPKVGYVSGLDAKPENLVTTTGWDNVTGVGSPNGINFINAFK